MCIKKCFKGYQAPNPSQIAALLEKEKVLNSTPINSEKAEGAYRNLVGYIPVDELLKAEQA